MNSTFMGLYVYFYQATDTMTFSLLSPMTNSLYESLLNSRYNNIIDNNAVVMYFSHISTSLRAQPVFCKMGTRSFPGGKIKPGHAADPPTSFWCCGYVRLEVYLYTPSRPHRVRNGITLLYLSSLTNFYVWLFEFHIFCSLGRVG